MTNVLDIGHYALAPLDGHFGGRLNTVFSTVDSTLAYVMQADLAVGAVLVPAARSNPLLQRGLNVHDGQITFEPGA